MKSRLKIAVFVISLLVIAGIGTGIYLFNLRPGDLNKVKPDFTLTAPDLFKYFEENEAAATKKYVNKIVEVSGEIGSAKPGENGTLNVSLKTGSDLSSVICTFPGSRYPENMTEGSRITIRGECSGYLMDVLLNNCAVIKPTERSDK